MASKVKVEGTVYNISKGKSNIEGTMYNVTKGKTLIENTEYSINHEVRWEKWNTNVVYTYGYRTSSSETERTASSVYKTMSFDKNYGFRLSNVISSGRVAYGYAGSASVVYYGQWVINVSPRYSEKQTVYTRYTQSTDYSKGTTSYGTVSSTNPSAYPTNGRHTDGYWYVKIS